MSELKCPVCNTLLEYDIGYDGDYSCSKCGRNKMYGSKELWQELIRTRKALEIAKDGLEYLFTYDDDVLPVFVLKHVMGVLDQIKNETALEQKDK